MAQDDPFASPDTDRTVIIPSPGRRAAAPAQPAQPVSSATAPRMEMSGSVLVGGLNPLIAAANPLLDLVPQLRSTLQHADASGLRDYLAQHIKTFESRAKAAGVAPEKVIAARYALCTLLDETASSTPWGGSGVWAKHSLLVMFHSEAWGGEKFFQLLAKLAENPAGNRDLLEFMYVCLSLGLEGRYRVIDNGKAQLDALTERLAQMLRKERGEYERDLSPHWLAAPIKRSKVLSALPLWVALAAGGLVMLVLYLSFSAFLNGASDPVFAQIQSIRVKAEVPPPPPLPAPKPRLAGFLVKEIEDGLVSVSDEDGRSVVTLKGDGLFAPGSAEILPTFLPIIDRIAEALNAIPGHVQISGYTDNQPIRSARFPSNWHLSQERARSVMQLLEQKVAPANRFSAEGRADADPIAPNDTAANRARNRRVEITLFVSHAGK
jgi:type VI secretion system protein ImpK